MAGPELSGGDMAGQGMNVVWIVVDTLRSDHLGCYGYFRDTTPHIDRLAAEGVLFEDSYASAIATGPGFTSLFTGLAAIHHGFYLTPWNVPNAPLLDDRIMTLPELIQWRGDYTTAGFDNLINFYSHMKQFVRGFEYYVNVTRSPAWVHHHITAGELNHRLLPWLEGHADEPFFLFAHYWDPHTPYNMPEAFHGRFDRECGDLVERVAPDGYTYVPGWGPANALPKGRERHSIDCYDDEIAYVDYEIGRLRSKLEELDLWDHTVIVLTADHGEDLDLHGMWGHGFIYESTIRVPLIIRDPNHEEPGQRVRGFVQHADNLPTILRYFPKQTRPDFSRVADFQGDLDVPSRWDGADLMALDQDQRDVPEEIVIESHNYRALISPPWKAIRSVTGEWELYDLVADPLELHDRAGAEPAVLTNLQAKLQAWEISQLQSQEDPWHKIQTHPLR